MRVLQLFNYTEDIILCLVKFRFILTGHFLAFTSGLEECLQSRPPMQLDLTGPKPTTYDPPTSLPWETSSPRYTMRPKTQPEKGVAI